MPQVLDAPVPADALTTFVREMPKPINNRLTEIFGTRLIQSQTVDYGEIIKTNRTAKYRTFDGSLAVTRRDTGSEKRVPLAPLGSMSPAIGEYERLQIEFARTGGTNKAALVDAIYNDGENLTNEIYNRIELAWGDVLVDGKLTINENGLQAEADYGIPPNHLVAPSTLFSDLAGATPLTNMQSWSDTYTATNGFPPGSMLTSLQVIRNFQRSKEVIDAVFGATQGRTRVNRAELNTLLSSEGFPTLEEAYDNVLDVDGVSTRVIPADRLIFLPPNPADLGYAAFGVTSTALALQDAGELSAEIDIAGFVAKVEKASAPQYRKYTFVDATGQPILANARRLMVADVL